MNEHQTLVRGQEIHRLVTSPVFESVIADLRQDYATRILTSPVGASALREEIYRRSAVLDDVIYALQEAVYEAESLKPEELNDGN